MRSTVLVSVLVLAISGCHQQPGSGLWHLTIGGQATLVSSDGSDITLETLSGATGGKTSRRSTKAAKVEEVKLPAGTTVLVLAVDGDDARVEIKEGPKAGSVYWVECSRLEAVKK
jgi:hypothetical protein